MSAVWWLALAGLPVFQHPLPESPGEPAAIALAAGRISLRAPCYELVCPDAEWSADTPWLAVQPRKDGQLPSPLASPFSKRYAALNAPVSRRVWVESQLDKSKVGASYRFQALSKPGSDLQVQLGTGYRLLSYDDNAWVDAPVARGSVVYSRQISPEIRFQQQAQIEAIPNNTNIRQTFGFNIALAPKWALNSAVEFSRDTGFNSTLVRRTLGLSMPLVSQWTLDSELRRYSTTTNNGDQAYTEGSMNFRYAF